MASEISVSCALSASKGGASISQSASATVDMAGEQMIQNVQIVGFATPEAILLGDVTTPGYMFFKNLDATNFVTILFQGEEALKLLPGEISLVKLTPAVAVTAQANTAACNLLVAVAEA